MKASYDRHTDTLSVILRDEAVVAESDEDKPGIILDYDQDAEGPADLSTNLRGYLDQR